jgi:CRP/FNR family transcriptional regulator
MDGSLLLFTTAAVYECGEVLSSGAYILYGQALEQCGALQNYMIGHIELQQLFQYYPALRDSPSHFHEALQRDGQHLEAPAGQVLFDVGSPCDTFLMLCLGSVRVIRPGRSGQEILLYRLRPGESGILAVCCLLGRADYPARGIVESNLSGYSIPQTLFVELVEQSPAFRAFIFRSLAPRLTQLMELIEAVAFQRMDQRLAALLLQKGVSIRTTHQSLADELGTAREVVSRTLEDFERQGILKLQRGHIHIQDMAALEQVRAQSLMPATDLPG